MLFAKLWLLGLLAAVLFVAATPPSSSPIILSSSGREQPASVPVVQPCPDVATPQIAAAEERLTSLIERDREEFLSAVAQATAPMAEIDRRLTQIEERLRPVEDQATERKADVQSLRGAMIAPLVMTWVLTGLAAVVLAVVGYSAFRARRRARELREKAPTP
jgi:hypothetical protein